MGKWIVCILIGWLGGNVSGFAQSNIHLTHLLADSVLHGHYDPANFAATQMLNAPDSIAAYAQAHISADSLHSYIAQLSRFGNRNTGSDTVSNTWGIGAARRWVLQKFNTISAENEHRLLSGYLQFDRLICTVNQHRNIIAVLPGSDTTAKGFVLMEAHLDSRCDNECDINCRAYGADDNASGCALVLEAARVMSRFTYRRTIVFMLNIAEEQGLFGAEALSDLCYVDSIPVYAVLNNDVIGGVICGNTSSPPSCIGAGEVDSLNVRLFSYGGFNSPHKQLARFCKLEYKENLLSHVAVPMHLNIMANEDRTGRGGDHKPFRMRGYTAMRYTSANEHGNAAVGPGYTDHQHTSADSLGVDTDSNGAIDSFWVDFHYLARNAAINVNAAAMIGIGPETPTFSAAWLSGNSAQITLTSQLQYGTYRVAIRSVSDDWDSVYTITGPVATISGLPSAVTVVLSVASVDAQGVESLFSAESFLAPLGLPSPQVKGLDLLQNRPNPFDEATRITVHAAFPPTYKSAFIRIADAQGKEIQKIPITLEAGLNEVMFQHGYHATGVYFYSLVVDGQVLASRKMVME
jgi:hypothetical protein